MYHANVNVNLMEKNMIRIKSEVTINVDASVNNIIYVKCEKDYIWNHEKWKILKIFSKYYWWWFSDYVW